MISHLVFSILYHYGTLRFLEPNEAKWRIKHLAILQKVRPTIYFVGRRYAIDHVDNLGPL